MAKPPAMFIIEDDMAFISSIPGGNGSIIASEPMLQVLNHDEFIALVAREVGFLAAHNVRVSLALTWIRTANPLLKIVLMPLVLMSALMRGWADLSELTGDRAAVLLTGQESMLNLALVKLIIAQDPQTDVDQEDLEAYLHGSSDIAADSKQLERHFRIGKFIENQPNLRERIEQVQEYRKSDQGKAAFAKLAEMRASSAA
jgi:Zn-dependent protease with chaperone function